MSPRRVWGDLTPVASLSTFLPRPAHEVWAAVTTPDGVNAELSPLLRMTFPAGLADLREAPLEERVADCWLLAFGAIPIERHTLMFADIAPSGFVETSLGLLHYHYWKHERTVRPADGGCVVRDIVTVVSKVRALDGVVSGIAAAVFRHRHKRLRQLYS